MSVVDTLARDLHNATDADLLRIAWDALTLTAEAADALAWHDGIEPAAALAAGSSASAARDLLPPPTAGAPPRLPDPLNTSLTDELAQLLDQLRQNLDRAGRATDQPDQVHALHACADRTGEAAACLRNLAVDG
jgi:hypothetical protein